MCNSEIHSRCIESKKNNKRESVYVELERIIT